MSFGHGLFLYIFYKNSGGTANHAIPKISSAGQNIKRIDFWPDGTPVFCFYFPIYSVMTVFNIVLTREIMIQIVLEHLYHDFSDLS